MTDYIFFYKKTPHFFTSGEGGYYLYFSIIDTIAWI